MSRNSLCWVVVLMLPALLCCREAGSTTIDPGADPARGAKLVERYGCGGCHTIKGVQNATGRVGPPLTRIAWRAYLGGVLPNTRDNMLRWIRTPQEFQPGSAMPNLGVSEAEARDIAAYLYTR